MQTGAAPRSFTELIQRLFTTDERLGLYARPNIPSGKLGRALNDHTAVSPADVLACHVFGGGAFSAGGSIVLTATTCHYGKASFLLEDLHGATAEEKEILVDANRAGAATRHTLRCGSEEAARALARALDTLAHPPAAPGAGLAEKPDYSAFSKTSLDWLELRDEVLRTIDLLHNRFQDGKLSLLEYEEKKADLLSRL